MVPFRGVGGAWAGWLARKRTGLAARQIGSRKWLVVFTVLGIPASLAVAGLVAAVAHLSR